MISKPTKFHEAYVDGDILRYRCGWAVEYTLYHIEGLPEPLRGKTALKEFKEAMGIEDDQELKYEEEYYVGKPEEAIGIAKNYLRQIKNRFKCPVKVILSGDKNFREEIATIAPYKGNRPDRKPKAYDALTEWFVSKGAEVTDGIEADDLLAILSNMSPVDDPSVICSIDKDLFQVPGYHYDFINDELYFIDGLEAERNLHIQILSGDPTDNIKGIPRIGDKTAAKLLKDCKYPDEMMEIVKEKYKEAFKDDWKKYLNETAALVYILRFPGDKWEPVE